jgi:MYXO-CTERM domain-containing protein
MRTRIAALAASAVALAGGAAAAQEFPAADAYVAFRCEGAPIADAVEDVAGLDPALDLVGDGDRPTALRAADDDFLYLRLRLDGDPLDGAALDAGGWGVAFDVDGDLDAYDALVWARGGSGAVELARNDTVATPDDLADPPDDPPATSLPFADRGRAIDADGAGFGGDPDRFLDLAVRWDELDAIGLGPLTPVSVWAATSESGEVLDGDVACHDGAGGAPTLGGTGSDEATPDPAGPGADGDGPRLEGGGGCAVGHGGGGGLAVVGLLALVARRRRERSPSREFLPRRVPLGKILPMLRR